MNTMEAPQFPTRNVPTMNAFEQARSGTGPAYGPAVAKSPVRDRLRTVCAIVYDLRAQIQTSREVITGTRNPTQPCEKATSTSPDNIEYHVETIELLIRNCLEEMQQLRASLGD